MKDGQDKSQAGSQNMGSHQTGGQKAGGQMGTQNAQSGNAGGSRVQGEGDYESARRYQKDIGNFVSKNKDDIPNMAKDAENALDSPEGAELRRAEEEGKSKAKR
jgi:hypothetical protein